MKVQSFESAPALLCDSHAAHNMHSLNIINVLMRYIRRRLLSKIKDFDFKFIEVVVVNCKDIKLLAIWRSFGFNGTTYSAGLATFQSMRTGIK